MRVQLRIVAGSLRGRKLTCDVHEGLRPTPQMVREALFSILGNAVPGRPFLDVFAGTGANGLEALSRGASEVSFVERDLTLANAIQRHLQNWGVASNARVLRGDVYRWAERWRAPTKPVTLFVSPPFEDYQKRPDALRTLVNDLDERLADDSVLVIQGEKSPGFDELLLGRPWDLRKYGRNLLAFYVKGEQSEETAGAPASGREEEE